MIYSMLELGKDILVLNIVKKFVTVLIKINQFRENTVHLRYCNFFINKGQKLMMI